MTPIFAVYGDDCRTGNVGDRQPRSRQPQEYEVALEATGNRGSELFNSFMGFALAARGLEMVYAPQLDCAWVPSVILSPSLLSALNERGGGLSVNGAHIRISLTGGGTLWGSLLYALELLVG